MDVNNNKENGREEKYMDTDNKLKKKSKKSSLDKILPTVLYMGFCGLAGAFGGMAMVKVLPKDAPNWQEILGILLVMIAFVVILVIQIFIHELGHMVCGLMSGYEFISIRFFGFMIMKENGKLVKKKYSIAGTGGQCIMIPPITDGTSPTQLFNWGGCIANVIASVIAIPFAILFWDKALLSMFLLMFSTIGFYAAIINGIPLKSLGNAIDELDIKQKTVFGCDIGCSLLSWNYMDLDTVQTHHGRTTPVIYGVTRANPEAIGIAYMGDGGGLAIGAQHLVNASVRGERLLIIVVNNTNYGMTGGQMSPTTMPGQKTETTPYGRDCSVTGEPAKAAEMVAAIANKSKSYVARSTVSNPMKLKQTFVKALKNVENGGFSFVEVLSICPLNWRTNNVDTFARLQQMEEYFEVKEFLAPESV